MIMEQMRLSGRKGGAAKIKFFGSGVGRGDKLLHVTPGEVNVFGVRGSEVGFETGHGMDGTVAVSREALSRGIVQRQEDGKSSRRFYGIGAYLLI
jgi:hypothetical protein